jgi:hypothetical protein
LLLEGRLHDLPSPSYQVFASSFYKSRSLNIYSISLRLAVNTPMAANGSM